MLTLISSTLPLASLMVYVRTFSLLLWLLDPKTSILLVLSPCYRKRRWTKVSARSSSARKHPRSLVRQQSRVLFPCLLHPGVPKLFLIPLLRSEFRTSLLPSTTSYQHCEITVELVASVFATATSGLQAIGVLQFHKFMLYKKSRICVLRRSRKLTILLSKILNRPPMLRHS